MVYEYNNSLIKEKNVYNLGDYIQSLAALQYLPKNCYPYFINRENLRYYNGPSVKLIMNGWYSIVESNKITSSKIKPIYLSIHIKNPKNVDSEMIAHLKKYEPIGCRDNFTLKSLRNKGINAYFSSCLTLTLDIDYAVDNSERTKEIIFVDFSFGESTEIDNSILSLKAYNFENVTYLTHKFSINESSHIDRFKIAKKFLDKYARAKLVITTRLHVAFPCLALKTPVIFIKKKLLNRNRFDGLFQFLNTIGYKLNGKFEVNLKFDKNNHIINPEKYLKYANNLKKILKKNI